MGLNFTSTKPAASDVSFFTHQGNVPLPDCWRTWGALGAVGSAMTAHCGDPRPVTPAIQPAGNAPILSRSKSTVSAMAAVAEKIVIATTLSPFMLLSFLQGKRALRPVALHGSAI